MPKSSAFPIESDGLGRILQEAREKLPGAQEETVIDLSSIRKLDSHGLQALDEFADLAAGKTTKLILRGVNIDIYKVLKLTRLSRRFSFLD